ncbi:MAG TPA: erythromycin esterase family protein [Longimicrobiaceae bacterium]|jgi:erythromycin esterase
MRVRATPLPLLLLALALAAAPGCDSPSAAPPGEPGRYDVSWLKQRAAPFGTDAPGGDPSELAPLGRMVGSARMVALGEATHGTREFFRMKHRVLEYLVKEKGFNTFAIEASWAECERINDYVHGAPGDPRRLLSAQRFWTWNTQEVLDMIEWMRRHNQDPGGAPKVSFRGFDMQYSRLAMDDVEAFVGRVDPAALPAIRAHYTCFRRFEEGVDGPRPLDYSKAPAEERDACLRGILAAYAQLEAARDRYVRASSAAEYARALRAARVVVQSEELLRGVSQARDAHMAENAAWLLEQAGPGARVVLWAHNGHVANQNLMMGSYLRRWLGSSYVVVGFTFDRGTLNAIVRPLTGGPSNLRSAVALPAQPGSYEYEFERLGLPRFILDVRPLRDSPPASAAWMRGPLEMRNVGALYMESASYGFAPTRLPALYDVMIHFSETSASTLLPFVR